METITHLFQPLEGVDLNKVHISGASLYSITPWKEANFISRTILNFYTELREQKAMLKTKYDRLPIITDATSHVGGNTISFHLAGFHRVNSVEIDPNICQLLTNNLQVYHLSADDVHCGDYLTLYQQLEQDVIYIDAPWGGPDYIKLSSIDLFLGSINIIDLCQDLMTRKLASLLVLKVPLNYNFQKLTEKLPTKTVMIHKIYRGNHHSYNVIFCW